MISYNNLSNKYKSQKLRYIVLEFRKFFMLLFFLLHGHDTLKEHDERRERSSCEYDIIYENSLINVFFPIPTYFYTTCTIASPLSHLLRNCVHPLVSLYLTIHARAFSGWEYSP